jgi:hypothetical protein
LGREEGVTAGIRGFIGELMVGKQMIDADMIERRDGWRRKRGKIVRAFY